MKIDSSSKQKYLLIAVIVIGILLGMLILTIDNTSSSGEEQNHTLESSGSARQRVEGQPELGAPEKGPHGGKLFTEGDYGVEVTIYEQGVPPEFRLYTYQQGKPLAPNQSEISLTLQRLGRAPQQFSFAREKDYFKGNAVVAEPHSFSVIVNATHDKRTHQFSYSQEEARVAMTDQQLQQSGVEILRAGPASIQSTLQLIGEVRLNEDRTVHVVPRLSGIVESVSVNAGDRVRKGQVLAVISSQELADQRAELIAAQRRSGLAKTTDEREKKLWEEKISAKQDYLQAKNAYQEAEIVAQSARQKLASLGGQLRSANLTRYEIRSPIDGSVTNKQISVGTTVKQDAEIFVVSDLTSVWIDVTVQTQDLNAIKVGQRALVKSTSFEAEQEGKITYVGAVVGEQNRTATARVVLPNPEGIWRAGLPVSVTVVSDEKTVPVAVTVDGLQTVRDWTVVFGRYGEYLEARPLQLGRRDGKYAEVLKGIDAGDAYAAKNSFLIKADLGKSSASHDH